MKVFSVANSGGLSSHCVFVTNNGVADRIGVSQVVPYLSGLAGKGFGIHALSIEGEQGLPPSLEGVDNLHFHPINRRTGIGQAADRFLAVPRLARHLNRVVKSVRPRILHCRSYMPLPGALSVARRYGAKLLFDTRGFWVDQRLDSGAWNHRSVLSRGLVRYFRALEARAYTEASGIVVLTHDAKRVVEDHHGYRGAPIWVIPCSVDQSIFRFDPVIRRETRRSLGISESSLVIAYSGSVSGVYRMDLLYRFFASVRSLRSESILLILGDHDSDYHRALSQRIGVNLSGRELVCRKVPHPEVASFLNAADLGVSLIVGKPSSLGVSATKTGEYLACGLPVLSNRGIGDIDRILSFGENGLVLQDGSDEEIRRCAERFVAGFKMTRCEIKSRSEGYFSMKSAVDSYVNIYSSI